MQRTQPMLQAGLMVLLCAFGRVLVGQTTEARPGEGVSSVELLVQELDADEFSVRNQAALKLEGAGEEAIPPLERAVREGSHEAAARALDVLRRYHADRTGAVREAATAALERVAKFPQHPLAEKAEAILRPTAAPSTPNFAPALPAGAIAPARVQIQIGGAIGGPAGVARRIAIKTVNGVKETELVEGDRKLRLVQDPAKGIEVEVTEKQGGKETTRKYAAKDLDDLRKNHPEGAKAYDEITQKTGGAGGIQMFGNAGPRAVPGLPFAPRAPGPPNVPAPPRAANPLEQVDQIIKNYEAQIQRLKQGGDPNSGRMIESLERAKARLEEVKARLQPENK